MLLAVLYCFHLEVVDTFSHDVYIVMLNFVNNISFHIVFVLVFFLFFNYDANVLLIFYICKFFVQKNVFLYHFSNIGHANRKMKYENTHKKPRRAIAARRGK